MHDKKLLIGIIVLSYAAGLVPGISCLFTGRGDYKLRERLEQVNRDLGSAIDAQREAAERAGGLQTELQRITEYARSIETGTGRITAGAGSLAERLDRTIEQSGIIGDGIDRASFSLEESRILLGELGTILHGLQNGL